MRGFFKAIWRQRRRIITGIFGVLFLALIIANSDYGGLQGIPAWALGSAFLIIAPIVALPIIALVMIVPSIRNIIEIVVIASIIEASLTAAFPQTAFMLELWGISGFLWFAMWLTLYFFLYGTLSDRLPTWFSYTGKARFTTTATPADVIAAATPSPSTPDAYYTGALEYIGPDETDEASFNVRYAIGESLYEHQQITVLENAPDEHLRYYFIGDVSTKNANFAEGIFDVKTTALPNGKTKVEIIEERPNMRLRQALWNWFDDSVGDAADALRANLEGRSDWSFTGRFWRKVAKLA